MIAGHNYQISMINSDKIVNVEVASFGIFKVTEIKAGDPAFFHANNEIIINIESTASTGSVSYITDVPGVYESVSVPDMAPTIEPRYFLGTTAKRQPAEFYAGQQAFSGGISDMVLLNANPLRFPIGKMITVPSAVASGRYDRHG